MEPTPEISDPVGWVKKVVQFSNENSFSFAKWVSSKKKRKKMFELIIEPELFTEIFESACDEFVQNDSFEGFRPKADYLIQYL